MNALELSDMGLRWHVTSVAGVNSSSEMTESNHNVLRDPHFLALLS
jgi:hypothetical protein